MFEKPFRLHFLSVVEKTLRTLRSVLLVIIILLFNNLDFLQEKLQISKIALVIGALFLFTLVIFIVLLLRWRKTFVSITEDTIVVQSNIIVKSRLTIGIKNISTVNLEQNLIERLFGTCQVKIDTNSRSTANKTDVTIILEKEMAKRFREAVLTGTLENTKDNDMDAAGTVDGKKAIELKKEIWDTEYDWKSVLKHIIVSKSLSVIIASVFLGISIFFENGDGEIQGAIGRILITSFVLISTAYSVLQEIARILRFKVRRENEQIHISCGLFTQKRYTVPVEKINAVVVRQTLLARICRLYMVELINVGIGNEKNEVSTLLVMSKKDELIRNMNKILPEMKLEFSQQAQPRESLIPIAVKAGIWLFIISTAFVQISYYFLLAVIPMAILVCILIYRTRKMLLGEEYVYITNGIFAKKTLIVRYGKVQKIQLTGSIITKKLGISKANIFLLATTQHSIHATGYFKNEQFEQFSEKMVRECSFGSKL